MSILNQIPTPSFEFNAGLVDNRGLLRLVRQGQDLTGQSAFPFTRNSNKKLFDNAGIVRTLGVNRPGVFFNRDGINRGYYPESARTNLLNYSSNFNDSVWSLFNGTVISTNELAPDGTNTAYRVRMGAGNAATLRQNRTITNETTVNASIFLKQGTGSTAFIDISDKRGTADITPTSQWLRYDFTDTWSTSAPYIDYEFRGTSGVAEIIIWGAQLEEGSFASSYIANDSQNLFLHSQDFADSYWQKANVSINSNTTIAPDGTLTADTMQSTETDEAEYRIRASSVFVANTTYTMSVFVLKQSTGSLFIRELAGERSASINLNTGVVSGASALSPSRVDFGTFWRFVITFTTPSTIINNLVDIGISIPSGGLLLGSNVRIWGAQLEFGTQATSYKRTIAGVGGTVTRSPDILTYTNATDYVGQSEGVVEANLFLNNKTGTNRAVVYLSDGTLNNFVRLEFQDNGTRMQATVLTDGTVRYNKSSSLTTPTINGSVKIAFIYKSGGCEIYLNGQIMAGTVTGAGTFTLPNLTHISIGQRVDDAIQLNDGISTVRLYKTTQWLTDDLAKLLTRVPS